MGAAAAAKPTGGMAGMSHGHARRQMKMSASGAKAPSAPTGAAGMGGMAGMSHGGMRV